LEFFYYEDSFLIFVLYFIMHLTFAILCVFYVCAAIGIIINDDDYDDIIGRLDYCIRFYD